MSYTLLSGAFVIRYADLPHQGPEPDGDTIKFAPDTPALVETLPRISGRPPKINARGISVRFEAIDALETHFEETHQELAGANDARDAMLADVGFTNVIFFPDSPNQVESADQDSLRGHVLSNGIDANGRMIGFVYPGDPAGPDGSTVFLDEAGVDASVNARLLAEGRVYPAFYGSLPATLRTHLSASSRAARDAQPPLGLWPRSTADPNGAEAIVDLDALEQLVIWPKLFRRVVSYFAAGFTSFDGFDTWLRADPVHRDDKLFLLDRLENGNLHDVVSASGSQLQLTAWPEDFIIEPDPAPPGAPTGPRPATAGDVLIVAALPDPVGPDQSHESVTVLNTTSKPVELAGWHLVDSAGGRQHLTGTLAPGDVLQLQLEDGVSLGNTRDALLLLDAGGGTVDQVSYEQRQVRSGRTICFGRDL